MHDEQSERLGAPAAKEKIDLGLVLVASRSPWWVPRQTAEQRFLAHIVYPDKWHSDSRRWEWIGTRSRAGYGKFSPDSGLAAMQAHRWSYEQFVGPIPTGLELDHHLCYNRACCQPLHLEPALPGENVRRAWVRRNGFGPDHWRAWCSGQHPRGEGGVAAGLPGGAQRPGSVHHQHWRDPLGYLVAKLVEVSGYGRGTVKRVMVSSTARARRQAARAELRCRPRTGGGVVCAKAVSDTNVIMRRNAADRSLQVLWHCDRGRVAAAPLPEWVEAAESLFFFVDAHGGLSAGACSA